MNAEESSRPVEDSASHREVQGIRRGTLRVRAFTSGSTFALFLLLAGGSVVGPQAATADGLAEALDTTNLVWTTGGRCSVAWTNDSSVTHDGVDAALTGDAGVPSACVSWLETTAAGPATLTFWWKLGAGFWDRTLAFSNGLPGWRLTRTGQADWQQETVRLPDGQSALRWEFSKSTGLSGGTATAWLDEVVLTTPTNAPPLCYSSPPGKRLSMALR